MESYAHYFFPQDSYFEFPAQGIARGVATGYADIGELLYTVGKITPDDFQSWIDEWSALAQRTLAKAEAAERRGLTVSARNAYRRACNYFGAYYCEHLAFDDWDAFRRTFALHRHCWDRAAALNDPPIERRSVRIGDQDMAAWFHPATRGGSPRPTLIYFSGADAVITETAPHALAAAARGFNLVSVEGPGQGTTLMDLGVGFRHDWENVVPPAIDEIEQWPEVDAGNLFLYGASQGGYFCLRGACGEDRLRGVILDPPIHDCFQVLEEAKERYGAVIALLEADDPATLLKKLPPVVHQVFNWRPFGYSPSERINPMDRMPSFKVDDERLATLTAPLLLLDPVHEHFWPGQGVELERRAPTAVTRKVFTVADGADSHCQLLAPAGVAEVMFDWMDQLIDRPVADTSSS